MVREFNSQIYLESSDYSNSLVGGCIARSLWGSVRLVQQDSAPCRIGQAMHPGRGARFLARVSRRGVSPDEDPGIAPRGEIPTTPIGRRTDCLTGKCDTLSGSYLFMMVNRFPGSSALRASTTGLKAGDPSGAPPLRDRTAPLLGCPLHRHRSSAKR